MNRRDYLWIGLRGAGLFFLSKAILLAPSAIYMMRMRDALLPGRDDAFLETFHPLAMGTSGVLTTIGVYVLAAGALMLMPVRES